MPHPKNPPPPPQPELVADIACRTGENPLWHPDEQRIYWTDIPNATLHRMTPGGLVESFDVGAPTGGFTIQENGELLLFMARGAVRTWRDGAFTGTVLDHVPGEEDSRFNDVIADPAGRVFCGTMTSDSHAGRLYRLDPDGTLTRLIEGMGTPNGMGFAGDRQHFFQQDSRACNLYRYDYNEATGKIYNREILVHVDHETEGKGRPDGMTVDSEDCIWSARWDGGRVVRYSPAGEELGEILLPVRNVSCITFGGNDLRTAYLTTAGGHDRHRQGELAGSLFKIRLPTTGRREFRSRIPSRNPAP